MTPNEIKTKRKEKKMTQTEVALKIGVSLGAYRLWETGGGKPNSENLKKLKKILITDSSLKDKA